MVAKVVTVAPIGVSGSIIEVECDASNSLPSLQIVGLGNKAIDEARERVRSAITNSMLDFPKKRITINLAPAELPKDGTHYDLPIALAVLCISGQIRQKELDGSAFAGEIALDGNLRPVKGIINITQIAKQAGAQRIFLPLANAKQASLINGIEIYGITSIKQLYLHLKKEVKLSPYVANKTLEPNRLLYHPILDDIKGQEAAKRALIIAAAGHHNILFSGPPGAGKTMLAKTLVNLLPELTPEEQIEVTKVHSISGNAMEEIIIKRPFRAPHHTASLTSIIGGGNYAKPGEISLAHTGVLFLDEIPEYPRSLLESLRQPLEDRMINISRTKVHISYPADFMLAATMNPCPCGYYGDSKKECECTSTQINTYQKKLSGPLMDRIDLVVNVSRVPNESLLSTSTLINSQHLTALEAIKNANIAQTVRYNSGIVYNSSLNNREIYEHIKLSDEAKNLLVKATDKLGLTARSYFKIVKVARTIADLANESDINIEHISEALRYRKQRS